MLHQRTNLQVCNAETSNKQGNQIARLPGERRAGNKKGKDEKAVKGIYAAVFEPRNGKVYTRVPDMPGCVTSGTDMKDAYEMTLDAANLWMTSWNEDQKQDVPQATPIEQVECPEGALVMLIPIDTDEYMRQIETRAVRRTVSIPAWMDQMAQKQGISLSKVLQDALRKQFA